MRDWAVWQARGSCDSQAGVSSNDSKSLYIGNASNDVIPHIQYGLPRNCSETDFATRHPIYVEHTYVHVRILSHIFRPLSSPSLPLLSYPSFLPSFLPYSFFLLLISFSTRFCPGYISLSLRGNKTQGREEGQRREGRRGKGTPPPPWTDPLITAIIVQSGLLC